MCAIPRPELPGYRRVSRSYVRFKRIHAFAAERWADAATPARMRFWKAVMDAAIGVETTSEPIPGFWERL